MSVIAKKGRNGIALLAVCALLFAFMADPAGASTMEVVVRGLEEPLRGNVETSVKPFRLTGVGRLTPRRQERMRREAKDRALAALRPFGYYQAAAEVTIEQLEDATWRLAIDVEAGPPVRIVAAEVVLSGDGAGLPGLVSWRSAWPLTTGRKLDQTAWEKEKQRALDIASDSGYLLASFTRHRIALDLERNEARLELELDTGPRAVMGEVRFHQEQVFPYILEKLPRFRSGDPYDAWQLERFRVDLWRAGYFRNAEITEDRKLEELPPRVDLDVRLEPRPPNTWQGTIGMGSDTGARALLSWNRHLVSQRGDSFSLAMGWQEHNDEYHVRANYRIPRSSRARRFWSAGALLKRESETPKIRDRFDDETLYNLGDVDIADHSLRLGHVSVLDRDRGRRQWFETLFLEYLDENLDYTASAESVTRTVAPVLGETSRNLSLGLGYDMSNTSGQGFESTVEQVRSWGFVSNDAWGSDFNFVQAYLSAHWSVRLGAGWKLLARGELGYSDAQVREVEVIVDNQPLVVSVTELPNLYRFKAGGSTSVRGYGFETLSDNNIGSNNIVAASIEIERQILKDWSLAAFFDAGNAFNDWGEAGLKKGAGIGVRWYSIVGAVRVDLAQALDLPDRPWRIHFTIGVSLL
jgi:translocation and assembly module TamA